MPRGHPPPARRLASDGGGVGRGCEQFYLLMALLFADGVAGLLHARGARRQLERLNADDHSNQLKCCCVRQ